MASVLPGNLTKLLYPAFLIIMAFFISTSCNRTSQQGTSSPSISEPKPQQDHRKAKNLLSDYVYQPDDAFDYEIVDKTTGKGYTTYVIRMVSQEWLTTKEVTDPVWWHWLTMVVPDGKTPETGLLFVGGGSRKSKQPKDADEKILQIALQTNSVAIQIHNIPNQHMVFKDDDFGPRKEDELIAYGWRKFLESGGSDNHAIWMARLPMTKAVVRAMDVITDVSIKEATVDPVSKFVIAGASKRGWTTWTTGATDNRVVAIVPIVIDLLNMVPSFRHHWRAYGRWADAIYDYNHEGIMEWENSEEYQKMIAVTEPYSFLNQLKIPKLILNATGDQFFLPDSWQFYWDDLKGEKHIRYIPNTDHGMKNTDVLETLVSFYQMILANQERPEFDWSVKNGTTSIQTKKNQQPLSIKLWKANNPDGRNFQLKEIGEAFETEDIPLSANGKYTLSVEKPSKGWTAYFVELTFQGTGSIPLKLTTGVVVTPDTYPFDPFESKELKGTSIN